jgi:hypothetical protein
MNFIQLLVGCDELAPIISLIKGLFTLIKILVPIILIIYGAIDLTKAIMASDDKEIKAATSKLIKRTVAAVAVFFIVTLVSIVMDLVAGAQPAEAGSDFLSCWRTSSNASNTGNGDGNGGS